MTQAIDDRKLRLGLIAASVVMVLVSVAILVSRAGGDGDGPPANRAAAIVPRDAQLYFHVSTDRDRDVVNESLELFNSFPGARRIRDGLINRFGGTPTGSDAADIAEWLDDEAAFAVLPTRDPSRSDAILLLESSDRDKTERYLRLRLGREEGQLTERGATVRRYGGLWIAWVGDFLAVGSYDAIAAALALDAGQGTPLSDNEAYRRVTGGLPDERAVDAYARPAGLRGVLVPQRGLLGLIGALADRQALVAVGAAIRPEDGGAEVVTKSLSAVGAPRVPPFEPTLLETVPADAIGMLATNAPGTVLPRALDIAGQPGATLRRVQADVEKRTGIDLDRDIAPLLASETVVSVRRGVLAPVFTLVARVRSEATTRARLARLRPGSRARRVGGIAATEVQLRPGLRVVYTVNRGRLIASTNVAGVLAALRPRDPITGSDGFRTALSDRPSQVTSLLFLDFSQLLGLGEQSGLADDPGYARSRADLRRIQSIGAASSAEGNLTTLELFLEIS